MAVGFPLRADGGAEISARGDGAAGVEKVMAALVQRFGHIRPLMERFGSVLETSTIERFNDERAPDGSKWLPSMRVRATSVGESGPQKPTGKTLTDTGRLKLSIRSIASPAAVETGTNVVYARRHQEGFDGSETVASHKRRMTVMFGLKLKEPREVTVPSFVRSGNTPKRAFLGLSGDDREELDAQVVDYVAEVAPDVEA